MKSLVTFLAMLLLADVTPRPSASFPGPNLGLLKTLAPKLGTPRALAFSPDESRLAICGTNGCLVIYATSTWKPVVRTPEQGAEGMAVAFSPDSDRIAVALQNGKVHVYSMSKKGFVANFETGTNPYCLAWPPGNQVILGGASGTLKRFDAGTGRETGAFGITGGDEWIMGISLSPDGKRMVTPSSDGSVGLWNLETGEGSVSSVGGAGSASGLAATFCPDGKRVAYSTNDNGFAIHEFATGKSQAVNAGHAAPITALRYSPDGKYIVTASEDKSLRVWKVEGEKQLSTLKHHTESVNQLAMSRNGRYVASLASDYQVKIWGYVQGGMTGTKPKGYLGVMVATDPAGCRVSSIVAGTVAERAGIRVGDYITQINGEKIKSLEEAIQTIGTNSEGDEIEVELKDDAGATRTVKCKLGKRPEN